MKLKKILFLEIALFITLFIVTVTFLGVIPSLQPKKQNASIGLYNTISFPKNTINLPNSKFVIIPFQYSTYDPAIIILDLLFPDCEKSGNLIIYLNYRRIASIFVTQDAPPVSLNLVSFSGSDWVEPPSAMFGLNEFLFESESLNGFAGDLTYQITLRGSK